jgi:hypothetical protein
VKALKQVLVDTALAVFIKRPQAEYQIGAGEIIAPTGRAVNLSATGLVAGDGATHTRQQPR